jgi:SAM-dependent methyltransferase
MSENSFSGWVDRVDDQIISGWAVNAAQPGVPANVSLYIDGARVATIACGQTRPDAVAAGHPGARAFSMEWRQFLRTGQRTIEIGFEDTNFLVPNGKHVIALSDDEKIGQHWSSQYAQKSQLVTRWWESEYIVRAINKRVCGEALPGVSAGMHQLALQRFQGRAPFARGVSIGAGTGSKEQLAMQCGLVAHFTLYELSQVAVDQGRKDAAEAGLADRMDFRMENGMKSETREAVYDLVYWNNALHHMFDVKAALEWSRRVLKKGGVFLMDDFVGPDRMQWSDRLLEINNEVRSQIDPKSRCSRHHRHRPIGVRRFGPHSSRIIAAFPRRRGQEDRRRHLPSRHE